MAQCRGTTRSGTHCRLDAQPGSDYCHLHAPKEAESKVGKEAQEEVKLEMEDLYPLLMAGAMAAGVFLLIKTFGRWIPRL